jgi:disulfide bond formation protein DsbB
LALLLLPISNPILPCPLCCSIRCAYIIPQFMLGIFMNVKFSHNAREAAFPLKNWLIHMVGFCETV